GIRDRNVTGVQTCALPIYSWPLSLSPTVRALLDGVAELTGTGYDPEDRVSIEALAGSLGAASKFVNATLSANANPTQLDAGYKEIRRASRRESGTAEGVAG